MESSDSPPEPRDVAGPASLDAFVALLAEKLQEGRFRKLVLARPRAADGHAKRVSVRRIVLRGAPALSFVTRRAAGDLTDNLSLDDGLARIGRQLGTDFAHAHLLADGEDVECRISLRGQVRIVRRPAASRRGAEVAVQPHDRPRHRIVDPASPFLVELGIMDSGQRMVPAMARKWKQINKFVEILDHAIDASPLRDSSSIKVVDFGCGKGYLTFAAHAHLVRRFERVEVVGVELRPELVEFCNAAAQRVGAAGLRFVSGDLRTFDAGSVDVMVALHACDTATDHALDLGLRAGAAILVAAPCCHKELRPQMTSPSALSPLLRHGVHLGQEAEMLTDSLRALLLETCGYDASVFEFVALEHTQKNKMILATRRTASSDTAPAVAQLQEVKRFYGVREQCLETLLRRRGLLAA